MLRGTQLIGFGSRPAAGGGETPVNEGGETSGTTSSTTSHAVTLPTSIASGDLILVFIGSSNPNNGVFQTPSGYGEVHNDQQGASAGQAEIACYTKIAAGGETSVTVTSTGNKSASWSAYRLSGAADPATTNSTTAFGTSATPNPPSHSADGGSGNHLWFAQGLTTASRTITVIPSGYGNEITANASNNYQSTSELAVTAASEDPGTMTASASGTWGAATVAIEPA